MSAPFSLPSGEPIERRPVSRDVGRDPGDSPGSQKILELSLRESAATKE